MPWKLSNSLAGCVNQVFNFGLVPGPSLSTMASYAAITGGARKLPEPKSGVSQQSVVSTQAIHQVSNTMAETKTKLVLPISIQKHKPNILYFMRFQVENLLHTFMCLCSIDMYSKYLSHFLHSKTSLLLLCFCLT